MTREEEIVVETLAQEFQSVTPKVPSPINSAYGMGFYEGAQWADEHPSEETITKIVRLSQQYAVDRLKNGNAFPNEKDRIKYIKQHWNDEIRNNRRN